MQVRRSVRKLLVAGLGEERTASAGRVERRLRQRAADTLAPRPLPERRPERRQPGTRKAGPKGGAKAAPAAGKRRQPKPAWQPSDPFVEFPRPTMSRHELLAHLHGELRPRTYFEVGVADGSSMAQSRTRSIGVDPAFNVNRPLQCDVQLVKMESDPFFAQEDAFAHFAGTPVDLAFIDGLHLSEFALRDFMNTEKAMSRAGVVVIDDVLPRNVLEAARDRKTFAWTGDVYKVVTILQEQRPDLVVIPVNTSPTGTVIVTGLDPDSRVLEDNYEKNLRFCLEADPQSPPAWMLHRSSVPSADDVVALPWASLLEVRDGATPQELRAVLASLTP